MYSGKEIKAFLKDKDLTMEQAANKLGISRNHLYFHLNKAIIKKDFLDEIEKTFGELPLPTGTVKFSLNDQRESYSNAKDEIIASLKEVISTKDALIEMQRNRIAELEAQVNAIAVRNSA